MKKIYLSLAILAGIGLAGCNDSFWSMRLSPV